MQAALSVFIVRHFARKYNEKMEQIIQTTGTAGLIAKLVLFCGLGRQEIKRLFDEQECTNKLGCDWFKLHTINRHDGLALVISSDGSQVRIRMLPSMLWKNFRGMICCDSSDIKMVESKAGMDFDKISEIHLCVVGSCELTSKVSESAALDYIFNRIETLSRSYARSWEAVGLVLPIL